MAGHETPATRTAAAAGIDFTVHEYVHDRTTTAYGTEAVEALGRDPARVYKTLVAQLNDELVVCLVPVAASLNLKALGKRAAMAPVRRAESATGYVAGGISPLGQRRAHRTLVDASAPAHATVFISAGRRGLEIELAPADLIALTGAELRRLT